MLLCLKKSQGILHHFENLCLLCPKIKKYFSFFFFFIRKKKNFSQLRIPQTGLSVLDAQSPGQSVLEAKQLAKQGLAEVGFDHRGVKYL